MDRAILFTLADNYWLLILSAIEKENFVETVSLIQNDATHTPLINPVKVRCL